MRIINNGSIEGWFIALCETILVFTLLALGFFVVSIREAWRIMGPYVQTIFPLTFGSWLAYKAIKAIGGKE